jgi:hypothetical protein
MSMKRNLFAAVFLMMLIAAPAIQAQAPAAPTAESKILALAQEVLEQQTVIAENQGKIEAKLAAVTETVRVARIFTSRAGGAHKAPAP